MQHSKNTKDRKEEILDAAEQLFTTKGFDGTTTDDILQQVGIARGTLYYHFKSKEDIMDALIERLNDRLLARATAIASDRSTPVLERIVQVVQSLNQIGDSGEEMKEHLHQPQNALMHQKIQYVILNGVTPIMAHLIEKGNEQGIFNTPYPYETMEMIIHYVNIAFDHHVVKMTPEKMDTRSQALIYNTEKLLGAKQGSLAAVMQLFKQE